MAYYEKPYGLLTRVGVAMSSAVAAPLVAVIVEQPQPRVTDIIESLRDGFAYSTFALLQDRMGLSASQLGGIIQVPTRTLQRRRASGRFGF